MTFYLTLTFFRNCASIFSDFSSHDCEFSLYLKNVGIVSVEVEIRLHMFFIELCWTSSVLQDSAVHLEWDWL